MKKFIVSMFLVLSFFTAVHAQQIELPPPQQSGGQPLYEAIKQRRSNRELGEKPIDRQTLADLLWVAYGFNREGMRVVPTALNRQELDVYVILPDGAYLYDAKTNTLIRKASGDLRSKAGTQDYVHRAPLNLIYVADRGKETGEGAYLSCGCAVQNVYLVCAAKNLGCRVRTSIEKEALHEALQLGKHQEILAGQTIGHPRADEERSIEELLTGSYLGFEGDDRIGIVIAGKQDGKFPVTIYEDGLPGDGHDPNDDDRYVGSAVYSEGKLEIRLERKFDGRKEERVERVLRELTASVTINDRTITLHIPKNREWDRIEVSKGK